MKLALATLSYMLVIHLKGSNLLLGDNCGSDCPSSRCCADDLHRQGNTGYSVCQETVALNISGRSGKAIRSVCLRGGKAGLTLF